MELTPPVVGTAVGVGMGFVDRGHVAHEQLLYRGGGLAAALLASHQGWGPANVAPAATTSFAAHFAARLVSFWLDKQFTTFGDVANPGMGAGGAAPATPGCGCGGSH